MPANYWWGECLHTKIQARYDRSASSFLCTTTSLQRSIIQTVDYYRQVTTSPFLFDSDQTYKYNSLAFEKKQIKLDIVMLVVQCF